MVPTFSDIAAELDVLVAKYAKNKANISEADYKGKYKKAFTELEQKICNVSDWYLRLNAVSDVAISEVPEAEFIREIHAAADDNRVCPRVAKALFQDCSMESFKVIADEFKAKVEEAYYKLKEEN